jgi:transposase
MIVVIDNAEIHYLQQLNNVIPDNIKLIRIPPYSPELNPSEKVWAYIKQFYKNKMFDSLNEVKNWLSETITNKLNNQLVKSITRDTKYLDIFKADIMA